MKLHITTFLIVPFLASAAIADVPVRMSNQGVLLDGSGDRVNGSVTVAVGVYTNVSAGSAVFSENIGSVAVTNGVYSFQFGSNELVTALMSYPESWLQVSIDGTPLSPRHRLSSVPYATVAGAVKIQDGNEGAGKVLTSDASGSASWQNTGVPAGCIMVWPTDAAPATWLLCDGSAMSRTTYTNLFAVIGTTYGVGDGSTTFNLPDMRGRFALGQDDMGGASANTVTNSAADVLGGKAGAQNHTLTAAEIPDHVHNVATKVGDLAAGLVESPQEGGGSDMDLPSGGGGDQPHNNMPPYLTLNYIIKY